MYFSYLLSKLIGMCYGMLYPAYCSYKAVKNKDVREYVHWMMYWIVFAFYSFIEVFADTFVGPWFPFYYELKIMFMLWLLSPTTRGGDIVYRRIIHPRLVLHETEIDEYLADFKLRTSDLFVRWGSRLMDIIREVILKTALRAGDTNIMRQVRRTYSLNALDDDEVEPRPHAERLLSADQLDQYISERMKREVFLQRGGGLILQDDMFSDDESTTNLQSKPRELDPEIIETKSKTRNRTSKRKKEVPAMYATMPRSRRQNSTRDN